MHELSIAQSMVKLAVNELHKARGKRVLAIEVAVGKISGVVPHALEFAFPQATSGTELEGSELKIHELAMETECLSCGAINTQEEFLMICPRCNSPEVKINKGKEISILSMEIE